jgi:acyl carrier protein
MSGTTEGAVPAGYSPGLRRGNAMIVSSRTPGGMPNRCPVCEKEICIEPSTPTGDAPCPHCGCLLWFVNLPRGVRLYKHEDISPRKRELIEGLLSSGLQETLAIVEFLMEAEEDLGIEVAEAEREKIKTLEDLIDFILRNLPD